MIEHQVDIATADGQMSTFVCHPERGGPYPVILFFMDAPGIREELRDMARRLATVGYYVMLPNLYYRSGVNELGDFIGEGAVAVREKMFSLMGTLTIPMVMSDADALVAYADNDVAVSQGKIGAVGYCMSGQYAISAAARYPDRVGSAASIYGVRLLTDTLDSPHLAARKAKGEIYVAWAETDHYAPLDELEPMRQSMVEGGVKAEVELYKGVEHGFAFPQRPAYDRPAAERHWERLFDLFGRTLR
ncbi:MAG TPA: dienelactone hydrolase family protein [Caulobacteraceae bacterium]|nr:dienelactone hydrolase family protein [Caulobacteraceae bacterium]